MIEIIRQTSKLFSSLKTFEHDLLWGIYQHILMLKKRCLSGTYSKFNIIFLSHFVIFSKKAKAYILLFQPLIRINR